MLKRTILQLRRAIADRRLSRGATVASADPTLFSHILVEERSPLWTEESVAEQALQLGKVHNLRVAVGKLNGTVLPANTTLSFWQLVGPPTRFRGFVAGRELREGCLVPAIGGGICQLSNAIFAAAVAVGAEIVERHAHSRVVPGSAAEAGRDATVAYNYIDLRFRAAYPLLIDAHLTADELVLRFRGQSPRASSATARPRRLDLQTPAIGSCANCGEEGCFQHRRVPTSRSTPRGTVYLVVATWPAVVRFLHETRSHYDSLYVPIEGRRWGLSRYKWPLAGYERVVTATLPTLANAVATRFGRSRQPAEKRERHRLYMVALARAYARRLRPRDTHLVVDQDLLATLWAEGTLGGRTFDVFASRPSLADLQAELDGAHARWPCSPTLGDYRAPSEVLRAETAALAAARCILTDHPHLRRRYGRRARQISDAEPATVKRATAVSDRGVVVFPGPTVGRKGCYELRAVLHDLDLQVRVLGRNLEGNDFWDGVRVAPVDPLADPLSGAAAVVLPSLWESHPPALVIRALAEGIPVITTEGTGVSPQEGVSVVAFGDVAALRSTLEPYATGQRYNSE